MSKLRVLTFALAFFLSIAPTFAADPAWRLTMSTGTVRVTVPGSATMEGTLNAILPSGTTVTTGADGRAVVENGRQRIEVAPNSRMTIATDSTDGMTRILEDLGTLLFQIDHRENPHFRVDTPLLAAIVKGTKFTVSTSPQQDIVHVANGLVEVRTQQGNAMRDVAAGETARVGRDAPTHLGFNAPSPDAGSLAKVDVPPLNYNDASDGVVDGPPKAGAGAADAQANMNQDTPFGDEASPAATAATTSGTIAAVAQPPYEAPQIIPNANADIPSNGALGGNNSGSASSGNAGSVGSGSSTSSGGSGAGNSTDQASAGTPSGDGNSNNGGTSPRPPRGGLIGGILDTAGNAVNGLLGH